MKYPLEFTPTQLKKNSSLVFNHAQIGHPIIISSRTRPTMILMTLDYYESKIEELNKKIEDLKG